MSEVQITNYPQPARGDTGHRVDCGGASIVVFKHRYQLRAGFTGSPIDLADLQAAVAAAVELQRKENL